MTDYLERRATVERPRSLSAVWCQRLAVFCIPYLLIVVLGHRFGAIDTISTFWLLGVAIFMLLSSLAAGAFGFYELWTYGKKGGMDSTRGVLLSLVLLAPFLYFAFKALALPQIYDVATDLEDLPAYDMVLDDRTQVMNPIVDPGEVQKRLQLESYPRVSSRRYPLGMVQVFRAVVDLVEERDWTILTSESIQGQAPIDLEGSGIVSRPAQDVEGRPLHIPLPKLRPEYLLEPSETELLGAEVEDSVDDGSGESSDPETEGQIADPEAMPIDPTSSLAPPLDEAPPEPQERYIEAVATSFLFGFESDVVIRLVEIEEGTLVDMRATSRWGAHDLGSNAARITQFLVELDAALQGLSR